MIKKLIDLSPAFVVAIFLNQAGAAESPFKATSYSIKDEPSLSSWPHPVHGVLKKNNVTLKSVEVKDSYAVLAVEFPCDPLEGSNGKKLRELFLEILKANGRWGYTARSEKYKTDFDVKWDRKKNAMTVETL